MTLPTGQHPALDAAREDAKTKADIRELVTESRELTPVEFMAPFEEFAAGSWDAWRKILARLTRNVREFYAIVGRGAGKSRIVSLLACLFASRRYVRVAGEFIYIGVFGPDRKQAAITFRYVTG